MAYAYNERRCVKSLPEHPAKSLRVAREFFIFYGAIHFSTLRPQLGRLMTAVSMRGAILFSRSSTNSLLPLNANNV